MSPLFRPDDKIESQMGSKAIVQEAMRARGIIVLVKSN